MLNALEQHQMNQTKCQNRSRPKYQHSIPSQGALSGDESEEMHQPMEQEARNNTLLTPEQEEASSKISIVPKRAPLNRKALEKSSALGIIRPLSRHGGAPKSTLSPKEATNLKQK